MYDNSDVRLSRFFKHYIVLQWIYFIYSALSAMCYMHYKCEVKHYGDVQDVMICVIFTKLHIKQSREQAQFYRFMLRGFSGLVP